MILVAIESSCDETAVAVVRDGRVVLSDKIASQTETHALYGGVVPEIASRKHVECITHLLRQAMQEAAVTPQDVGAVACTTAPGLIGALLVGVSFAKALAFGWGVPFIPVHHIRGHVAANYIAFPELEPPFVALVASGGHSSLLEVRGYTDYLTLGITRDDAAGECFDKIARVLGLGYPGGPVIDKLAARGDPTRYPMPQTRVEGSPLDMSFSGLKTHIINVAHTASQRGEALQVEDLAASFSQAVSQTLVPRILLAAEQTGHRRLVLAGGVAANQWLRNQLSKQASDYNVYMPPLSLCGDNGAMIGAQGFFEWRSGMQGGLSHNAHATFPAHENLCKP